MSVTIRQMLEAGVHFGHQTRFWNPKMAQFIFGHRNKIHIINLEKTLVQYQAATKYVRQLAANRGTILFVGTKRQSREIIAEEAARAGMPYVDERWLGGMMTNFKTVKGSIKRLKDMEQAAEDGALERMTKKEGLMFSREREKLTRSLGGIKDLAGLPDALFIIDVGYHKIAVTEARKLGVPIVAVVDTNHSPEGIDYVIPGNDDSGRAVRLYARGIADAILEGRTAALQDVVKGAEEDEFVEVESEEGLSQAGRTARRCPAQGLQRPRGLGCAGSPPGGQGSWDGPGSLGAPRPARRTGVGLSRIPGMPVASRGFTSHLRGLKAWRKSPRAWSRNCAKGPTRP